MTLPVRKSLHDAVLQASKADTWEQATKEWNEVSLMFNGIGRSNCVCGNAIKYAYELFNGVTGQRLFPIGSDCVRHFHRLSLDQQLEEEEKLLRKVENLTRKAQKKEKIKVNKSDFDERLLKWLWEKGVFKPNRGNQFAPERDYQLFLEVFQGGSWTKAEPKKKARMEEVLEKCIKPFLLGKSDDQLYLVKLGKEKIDYEQELRIQAEKERKKRDKIAKQYADNLVLAMGPAERAYQDYFGFTETLTQEERKWEKILFGKNRAERAIKAKQYQKELEKDQRIASQDPIERKQKQTWLLNSYFRELPEEKARFSRLLLEYRKSGEVPFSTEEKTVFMIANISTIGFGAYDRYRSKVHPKGDNLNKFVEDNVREAAKRFRDHYDYWYKILEPENREKLYRSLLVYDAFKFGRDNTEDKVTYQADFETDHPAIKYFFGPAGNNVVHNGHGAYATGDAFYYMAYRMLDKDGAVTYTHEMTHNSDREIYLGGYGRRSGLGPEFYAKGLLQAPDHPYDPTITINSVLKYDDSENSTRLQVADPTQRFNSAEDLHNYMHNMFDLIYTLEILEGRAVAKLDYNAKNDLLRKIENKYKQDPDGNSVYATNVVRRLTMDEVNKLNSFDSLIENDIITSRGYKDQEYKRNGYYTIDLFSPIYSALSGEKGTPGDLMGRRIAFELLAAKGYKEGMVPYISNQYEKDAKAAGSKIKSYGKEVGLVTDKLVLEKVFNNRYSSWVEFKKAMYNERIAKFNNLISVSFNNPNVSWGRTNRITITSIANLQNMINTAVNEDAEDFRAQLYPDTNSRVLKLKKAIYKAYLDQTNDFRRSIFENKK